MDITEFRQYIFADSDLKELEYEQKLDIRRVYADIHPTRVEYNFDLGKTYKVGIDVASYAIDIVEKKELHQRQREKFIQRIIIYRESLKVLTKEEIDLINLYKSKVGVADHIALKKAFDKLIVELKRIIFIKEKEETQRLQSELDMKVANVKKQLQAYSSEIKSGKQQYLIKGIFVYMTEKEYEGHQLNEKKKTAEFMEFMSKPLM